MANATPERIRREAVIRWVPLDKMKVSPLAQRELNEAWVDRIVANLTLEDLGHPVLSHRDGSYYIIDGQHRVEALRKFGFTTETIEAWVYEGLTEQSEADKFLTLNNKLTIATMDRFQVAVTAGRDIETDIDRIVNDLGLSISNQRSPGAVGAVGTLRRIYTRSGAANLRRTLRIVRDAYGDPGFVAPVLDGVGLVCQRFNGQLDDDLAIAKLGGIRAGATGLLGMAYTERDRKRCPLAHAVAASTTTIINSGKGGKKLPGWWSS